MNKETFVLVSTNKTLVDADNGVVQKVNADGLTLTLPACAIGRTCVVEAAGVPPTSGPVGAGANYSMAVTVHPAGTDTMTGNGFTVAAGKGAVLTKATMKVGDRIELISSSASWYVRRTIGTWAREA